MMETAHYYFALSPSSLLLHFEPFLETADDGGDANGVHSGLDRFEVALLDEILKSKLSQLGNEGNWGSNQTGDRWSREREMASSFSGKLTQQPWWRKIRKCNTWWILLCLISWERRPCRWPSWLWWCRTRPSGWSCPAARSGCRAHRACRWPCCASCQSWRSPIEIRFKITVGNDLFLILRRGLSSTYEWF